MGLDLTVGSTILASMNRTRNGFPKIFYGWWIVSASVLCLFASVSVGQVIVSIFQEPVTTALGWPAWQYTLGPSLALGIGAFAGIRIGTVVDNTGPRPLIFMGAVVCALCFMGLAWQSNIWLYWALNILAGVVGWNLFGPLTISATLNKWFIQKRGWSLAIGSIGVSLGSIITPFVLTRIVDSAGWRTGYVFIAVFVLVMITPLAWVMRRTPEDMGLQPDGIQRDKDDAEWERSASAGEASLTRAEAVRTSSFWLLAVGFALIFASMMSILMHAIPFATDVGFTRATAAIALSINGIGNLGSKAVWGITLQRYDQRNLILFAYSLSSIGVGLMLVSAWLGAAWLLYLGFFCYGFGFGGTIPLSEFIWAKYFGRAHIGSIRGVGQLITIMGPTVAPVLIGLWFDLTGTYQPAFWAIISLYMVGALVIWVSREPRQPVESPQP